MLSIQAMSGGSEAYYLALAKEDYYRKGGEPPGRWYGKGAKLLNLKGRIEDASLRHVLLGYDPASQQALVRNAGKENRQPGWDLTFSAPKSVSVLWSQAPPETRQAIQQAQAQAVDKALDYIEKEAAWTRTGKGGCERRQAKLVVAKFEHGTSREQDPQLHTHALIANVGLRPDGSTGTIESHPIYKNKMAIGALYRAELAHQLRRNLGLEVEKTKTAFEIKGVSKGLMTEFSKRREAIEEALEEKGLTSAQAASVAALDTRETKRDVPRQQLFKEWQEVGRRLGWTTEQAQALIRPGPVPTTQDPDTLFQDTIQELTRTNSTVTRRDLVRHIAQAAPAYGCSAAEVLSLVDDGLNQSDVVSLGVHDKEARYTTRGLLEIEQQLLRQVEHSRKEQGPVVPKEKVKQGLACRPTLSAEQYQAAYHITATPGTVKVVSGKAGTGKTFMLDTARQIWQGEGYRVLGTALAGKAAKGLDEGAQIPSSTLHRLLEDLDRRKTTLGPRDIVVVDEAAMVGTRQLAQLVDHTTKARAKLVLVGDAKQLQPIETGGAFAKIGTVVGQSKLTDIRRQQDPWQRQAVHHLSEGEAALALESYARRGLVTIGADRQGAMRALVQDWQREGLARPEDSLILVGTNGEAATLNRMVQRERLAHGHLEGMPLKVDRERFYAGDRVLCTRNSTLVKNGDIGTVVAVNPKDQSLKMNLGKRTVTLHVEDYPHVKLGYATTTHKAQGATVDNCYVLAGGPMQDQQLTYVQASRARHQTRFYTDSLSAGEDLQTLLKDMSRSREKRLAHSFLEREEPELRPDVTQTPPPRPHRPDLHLSL